MEHTLTHGRVLRIITPTGPMAIVRSVAERLLQEGIVSGDLDGTLHATDAATVKAAMMTHGVCDFCSAPGGAEHVFDVPDFDMPLSGGLSRSTDGWATCGPCGDLIKANRRKDLFARALNSLAFAKFTKPAIQELHNRFWRGMEGMAEAEGMAESLRDFVNDKLPDPPVWSPEITDRDERVRALAKITGLTVDELERAIKGDVPPVLAVKMLAWAQKFGQKFNIHTLTQMIGGPRKPLPNVMPHWQQALDAKFEVAYTLAKLMHPDTITEAFPDATDLTDREAIIKKLHHTQVRHQFKSLGFEQDLHYLPTAQAYSFNAETEAAITEAAQGIPHDAPLSSIETPNTGAGWFWFSEPLAVAASPMASCRTNALLWAWVDTTDVALKSTAMRLSPAADDENERTRLQRIGRMPALMFSAYVRDEKGMLDPGKLFPSTRWFWPLHMSFHDMLGFNTASWRKTYGPGSPMEHDPSIISEDATIKIIADLSLFFVMACLWFRQTVPGEPKKKINPVLTQTPGHIERHARKRYQREHKLDEAPVVQVVALRKTARTAVDDAPTERVASARHYGCRWIVKGHPRMQACGPGRKDRKLIWIEAHPAGPEDKPLRTKTTVFAVVR